LQGVWDFFEAGFLSKGFNDVFLATTPRYTVSEVRAGAGKKKTTDPSDGEPWQNQTINTEANTFRAIILFRKHFGQTKPSWGSASVTDNTERLVPEKIRGKIPLSWIRATRGLQSLESIGSCSQFLAGPPDRHYVPPANFAVNRLRGLSEYHLCHESAFR
jgi:hypothetical protein